MLELKLYENTKPALWTEYIVVLVARKPVAAFDPATWTAIIVAACWVAIAIIITINIFRITSVLYKAPGVAISMGLIGLGLAGLTVLGIVILKKPKRT